MTLGGSPLPPVFADSDARTRWFRSRPFLVSGAIAVTTGGVVAAVTGPTGWSDGSWVAAFLVLVTGVGQIGLGVGQALLAPQSPAARAVAVECTLWNLASLAVVAGTIFEAPAFVTVGGIALLGALWLLATNVRTTGSPTGWGLRAYQALLSVLFVSTPVGIALSWIRS